MPPCSSSSLISNSHVGYRPAKQDTFFISIMVKVPVIQIISILLGSVILAFEYPAPFMKNTAAYRSLVVRLVLLLFQAVFAIMFYQVRFPCPLSTFVK